ncbi:hypothetical protein PH562_16515 [Rhizobium sp. CNPSo 4062]|uniref:hypothetical protein n=1 Tax=Rhizobium sp. CNPSo 4062 TaxID=3021410 RepID=UPI00254DC571|nr:hypothetical protein [Rhizobium sp. CNPSo 4062]MDK4703856.1 hypothetical protein [Rhizobium sp. CNPSo 4062]
MKPFDPTSKTDAVADEIRRMVVSLALHIFNHPDFRALGINQQAEVMTGGILTALMGVLHSMVIDTAEAHDELEAFVTSYVAQARAQAEGIANGGPLQ